MIRTLLATTLAMSSGVCASVAAQNPSRMFLGEELPIPGFVAGTNPIALADVNADGRLDIVTSYVSVLLGDGAGTFSAPTDFPLGLGGMRTAMVVDDLNADGNLDVAISNDGPPPSYPGTVSIFLGNGSGGFASPAIYNANDYPIELTVGDFDSDGTKDLVVGNALAGMITILHGMGGGVFSANPPFVSAVSPQSVHVLDANSDGMDDLVIFSNAYAVYLNTGLGGFGPPITTPFPLATKAPDIADFNGDGHPDLAIPTSQGFSVLLGDGTGGFTPGLSFTGALSGALIVANDLDLDGNADVSVLNSVTRQVSVFRGDGTGSFASPLHAHIGGYPYAVSFGDVDSDGVTDGLFLTAIGYVLLLKGEGAGGFVDTTRPELPIGSGGLARIAVGDVDHDGSVDLVTCAGTLSLVRGSSSGPATSISSTIAVPGFPSGVALGDMNGDGHLDAVALVDGTPLLTAPSSLVVCVGDGTGGFVAGPGFAVGPASYGLALVDLDLDGVMDVVTSSRQASSISVLRGTGGGSFLPAVNTSLLNPEAVVSADMNGDGFPDIVTSNIQMHRLFILLNNGSGGLSLSTSLQVSGQMPDVSLADVDSDGWIDIVAAIFQPPVVSVITRTTSGGYAPPRDVRVGGPAWSVALADLNADGILDVAAGGSRANATILLGTGGGNFGAAKYFALADIPFVLRLADMDNDGLPDLVSGNGLVNGSPVRTLSYLRNVLHEPPPPQVYCSGSGLGTLCPCNNPGLTGRGCANSQVQSGARLSVSGTARLSADTLALAGTDIPLQSPGLFVQGSAKANGGLGNVLGDGLVCIGGNTIRIGVKFPLSGTTSYPSTLTNDLPLSIVGAPSPGSSVFYQQIYRDPASFCTSAVFNATNGVAVVWLP